MELAPEYRYSVFKSPLLFHFSLRLNCRCPFLGALPYRRRARGFQLLSSNTSYAARELRSGNIHRHNQASLRIMPHLLARRRPFLPNKYSLARHKGYVKSTNVPLLKVKNAIVELLMVKNLRGGENVIIGAKGPVTPLTIGVIVGEVPEALPLQWSKV